MVSWSWWVLGVCSTFLCGAGAQGRSNFNPGDEGILATPNDLPDDRKPALYTADYGECMEDSAIKITRFDAAYYQDNMTISFDITGYTTLVNESLMIHLSVAAYGESRYDLVFNPCRANIPSLCPVTANINITATHAIPVSASEVSRIPAIAFRIPDFEGRADLRIFSNSTKSQTACVTALVTNGNSFSHPAIISPVLGFLTLTAGLASFTTVISGDSVISSRKFYAHTLSAQTLLSCFHSIYLTCTLTIDFPSVLLAFWSNFAWSTGIINADPMQRSIDAFTGGVKVDDGGLEPDKSSPQMAKDLYPLAKRYVRFGNHQKAGLPKPGNFEGFPATLAMAQIAVRNAFVTALLWFLVVSVAIAILTLGLKVTVDILIKTKISKQNRLSILRENWGSCLVSTLSKATLIAVFPLVTLATFQFTLHGTGLSALTAAVFSMLILGLSAATFAAYRTHWRGGRLRVNRMNRVLYPRLRAGFFPWMSISRRSSIDGAERKIIMPWWVLSIETDGERGSVHEDAKFIRKFGWLSSRFRRRAWWAFGPLLFFEMLRAIFHGGGNENPKFQLYGLLIVEVIYFIVLACMMPFESTRLNVLSAYMLPIMRISTLAILCAILGNPKLNRIIVTALGIVVIVIQGVVVVTVIGFTAINIYATYFKIAPREAQIRPQSWNPIRGKYLGHIEKRALDLPTVRGAPTPLGPVSSSFNINHILRVPKIDDEYDGQARSVFSRNSYMGSTARGEEPVSRVGSPNFSIARLQRPVWPADSPRFSGSSEVRSATPFSGTDPHTNPHPSSSPTEARSEGARSTHTATTTKEVSYRPQSPRSL